MNRKLRGKAILVYIWLIIGICFITPIWVGAETTGRAGSNTTKSVKSGLGKVADDSKKKSNNATKRSTTRKISDKISNALDDVKDSGVVGSRTKNDSIGNTKKKVSSGSDMSLSGANVDKVSGTTKGVTKGKTNGKVKKPKKPTGKPKKTTGKTKKTTGNSTKNTTKVTEKPAQKTVTTTRKKTDVIVSLPKDDESISRLVERINTTVGGNYILVYTPEDGLFSFSGSRYSVLSTKKKIKFM